MELKKGYKNTEIGVIPEDWVVKTLGEIVLKFRNGYGFSASGYSETGTPIVTMAQIGLNGDFQYDEKKVNKWKKSDFNFLKNYHLNDGDVIIAMTDVTPQKNLIGRMAIVKTKQTLLLNQRVGHLILDKSKINSYYLVTYSNMRKWRDYSIASASLGVQANIGTFDILNGKIDLPPTLEEQTRIATVLSDTDNLIQALEKKISKKQLIKKGAMQKLLSPKEDWVVKTLGEVVLKFQNGYGFSASGYSETGVPIVTMAQIGLNGDFQFDEKKANKWVKSDFGFLKDYHLNDGDVIIAMTDVTPQKNLIGRMAIVKTKQTLLLNQRVGHLILDKSKINSYFLITYSNMKKWRDYSISSASLGVQANIGTFDILKGNIVLPPTLEEQNHIAQILSDMDKEIETLEKKLAKYKQIKQGLMQVLLTGKIRLA